MVQFEGPKTPAMPMAATMTITMADDFLHATQMSLTRAREIDFMFLNDVLFKDKISEYNGYNT